MVDSRNDTAAILLILVAQVPFLLHYCAIIIFFNHKNPAIWVQKNGDAIHIRQSHELYDFGRTTDIADIDTTYSRKQS